jgi:hypothetical protein
MFICMDANFRLKNQMVSNYSQDPGLGIGLAYMVSRQPYEEYVLSRSNDSDVSNAASILAEQLTVIFRSALALVFKPSHASHKALDTLGLEVFSAGDQEWSCRWVLEICRRGSGRYPLTSLEAS